MISGERSGVIMKILHIADVHLGSPFSSFDKEKADNRNYELLETFGRYIEKAEEDGAAAVIISGDLFDSDCVQPLVGQTVLSKIRNSSLPFYYLRGNHDRSSYFSTVRDCPENLFLFDGDVVSYLIGNTGTRNVFIYGLEETGEGEYGFGRLSCGRDDINIVMLHGQLVNASSPRRNCINLSDMMNRNVTYYAMGHIHKRIATKAPDGSVICYPGCMESRGFDETDEHGGVMLDISDSGVSYEFIDLSKRHAYEISYEIGGDTGSSDVADGIIKLATERQAVPDDIIRAIVRGDRGALAEFSPEYIQNRLSDAYYMAQVKDETSAETDYMKYAQDSTLKGELIRMVGSDGELDDEKKNRIIKMAVSLLEGGDVL